MTLVLKYLNLLDNEEEKIEYYRKKVAESDREEIEKVVKLSRDGQISTQELEDIRGSELVSDLNPLFPRIMGKIGDDKVEITGDRENTKDEESRRYSGQINEQEISSEEAKSLYERFIKIAEERTNRLIELKNQF